MDEQNIMENILQLEKAVCGLYLHGTIESSTQEVKQSFRTALNDCLGMQGRVYDEMASKGWYQTDNAEQQKLSQVRQKFSC